MTRKKTPPAGAEHFGDFDGEVIETVVLKLTGGGRIDHRPGERIILTVSGEVSDKVQIARINGRLVRIHSVKVDQVAEPYDRLADEIGGFLADIADKLENKAPLPFDKDEGDDDDAT